MYIQARYEQYAAHGRLFSVDFNVGYDLDLWLHTFL